ncbi:MAG: helix-turn-helix domain-containing protein [Actinomycetota bacterium]
MIRANLAKRTPNALGALDYLFRQPVVSAKVLELALNVSQPTAAALVRELARIGVLRELTGKRRNRLFGCTKYLDMFPGAQSRD